MRVLLFGSGAREHALADKIASSKLLEKLFLAKTSSAFSDLGEVIEFDDYYDLAKKAAQNKIDLLVVGPEEPLVNGICDVFLEQGINVIGANKYWAQLEGSKIFAKEFMKRNGIKTAQYQTASSKEEFEKKLLSFDSSPVVKIDTLAGGKGVFVCESFEEAKDRWCDKKMLLEKRLFGREMSIFSLWDGKTLLSFEPACDFKKLSDNDTGPNTGGMGSVFPLKGACVQKYLSILKDALKKENANFCGIIYSGLIAADDDIYVLEYNMRFGDPEIQCVLLNMRNDILEIFSLMAQQKLDTLKLDFSEEPSYCVVLASKGYPYDPKKGARIFNIEQVQKKYGVKIFFAGVKKIEGKYYVDGGRVLSICKNGKNALTDIYKAADEIEFEGKIFRRDINFR